MSDIIFSIGLYVVELLIRVDRLLRGREQESRRRRVGDVLILLVCAGCWYGAVMGTYGGVGPAHWRQMIYSAVKVPLMLSATFWLSVPSFYVLNSLLGLRSDFASAMRAVVGAQAALTVILAAMAPITEIVYLSGCDYNDAILFNGLIFAVGSVGGQVVLRRLYQPLIARDHRHRWTLIAWLVIYVFVGIQMGWVLRPFIGDPTLPTQFLRPEALTNAYTSVMHIIWKGIQ